MKNYQKELKEIYEEYLKVEHENDLNITVDNVKYSVDSFSIAHVMITSLMPLTEDCESYKLLEVIYGDNCSQKVLAQTIDVFNEMFVCSLVLPVYGNIGEKIESCTVDFDFNSASVSVLSAMQTFVKFECIDKKTLKRIVSDIAKFIIPKSSSIVINVGM